MASNYQAEDDGVYGINVTPLVDVVLVLLVILMVTAPAIARRGIALQEPTTVSGERIESKLELSIDADQHVYVNGERMDDLDQVRAKIAELHREDPELKALISADRLVPHGQVMAVVDAVKLAGVRKFAFTSQPATATP